MNVLFSCSLSGKKCSGASCKAIVVPGQGSFDPAIENLIKTDLIEDIKSWINKANCRLTKYDRTSGNCHVFIIVKS